MRSIALVALLGCGARSRPAADEVVDITALGARSPAAARDLDALLDARQDQLSRCADPVRALVRQREPGYGRVGVVVHAVGVRGQALAIPTVSVAPRSPGEFGACVAAALRGAAPPLASGDYALRVRLHLCIDPQGAP